MASNFTPQQIEEFLQEFFDVVGARQYVGARYVPIFGRAGEDTIEWDATAPYEPLTVVMHEGVSYVSRRYVPNGIQITNTSYWVETYRFNAQVEQYRQEVLSFQDQIDEIRETMGSDYVPFPDELFHPKYGTLGQVLSTLADGTTEWVDPVVPSDAQAEAVITAWLDDHPEATTTVQDGAISYAKLAAAVQQRYDSKFGYETLVTSTSDLDDFDNALMDRIYAINLTNLPNRPTAQKGILLTYGSRGGTTTYESGRAMQVYHAVDGTVWHRQLQFSSTIAWTTWQRLTNLGDMTTTFAKAFQGAVLVNATTDLDDLDHAIIDRYYSVNMTTLPHQPIAERGHLLTFGINGGETVPASGRACQLYVTASMRVFYRIVKFATDAPWSEWVEISNRQPEAYASISMFERVGVIGDSFASGEIYHGSPVTHADYYALSWPQILGRSNGIEAVNYSKGGLTADEWLADTDYGLPKLETDPTCDLYVIALGINDTNRLGPSGLGTIADINSDIIPSFYSYYGRIVRGITAHAPNAIVMLSTLARFGGNYDLFSDAIREIASYYGFPLLDLADSAYFASDVFSTNQVSNHPVAILYSGMAKEYRRLIEHALIDNIRNYRGYVGD